MNKQDAISAALQLQHDAGLMASNLQVLGQCVTSLNVIGSHEVGIRSGDIPRRGDRRCSPGAPGTPCSHVDVSYGFVAPTGRPPVAQTFLGRCRVILINN